MAKRETITVVEPTVRAELETLRNRAYGPSADIGDDPDAQRRLAELERLSLRDVPPRRRDERVAAPGSAAILPETEGGRHPRSVPTAAQVDSEPSSETGLSAAAAAPVAITAADAAASGIGDERAPVRWSGRQIPRILWAVWGVSLVVVIALTAFATYGMARIAPVAVSQGAPQVATLEPNPAITVPVGWMGAGASSATYEFYGLTLVETTYGMFGSGDDCFAIALSADIPTDQAAMQNGFTYTGTSYSACRTGDFPATITMAVNSASPPQLRDRFRGASLQFVKDGDRIGVFEGSGSPG